MEFAQVEKQILDGFKVGNEALKKANDMFSIDEIEQILEDSAEAAAKQDEINAMLSGQLSSADEDDVFKELDELIQEDEITGPSKEAPEMPEVPDEELPGTKGINSVQDFRLFCGRKRILKKWKK